LVERARIWTAALAASAWLAACGPLLDPVERISFAEPSKIPVRAGDWIDHVAYLNAVPAADLRLWNGIDGDQVLFDGSLFVWPPDVIAGSESIPVASAASEPPRSGAAAARRAPPPAKARVVVIEASMLTAVESPTAEPQGPATAASSGKIVVDRASVRSSGVLAALGDEDGGLSEDLVQNVGSLQTNGRVPGSAGLAARRGDLGGGGTAESLGPDSGRQVRAPLGPEIGEAKVRPPSLPMPAAKACVAAPTAAQLKSEDGYLASQSLTPQQIGSVMSAFVRHTMSCIPSGTRGTYELQTRLLVGCDGRVKDVWIIHPGALPPNVTTCVEQTLWFASFPAHALPDGVVFDYPIVFRY
jgi:hypothetical protein